jgi:hypothetical protein
VQIKRHGKRAAMELRVSFARASIFDVVRA